MVTALAASSVPPIAVALPWLWAAEAPPAPVRPIEHLDPATRASLLMALLGIILLGIGMIVIVILSARMVRRWARLTPPSRVPVKTPTPPAPTEILIDDDDLETLN